MLARLELSSRRAIDRQPALRVIVGPRPNATTCEPVDRSFRQYAKGTCSVTCLGTCEGDTVTGRGGGAAEQIATRATASETRLREAP
jgi:hypothetical protein